MIDPPGGTSSLSNGYSPQLRTALVLTGTGTDGVYHAGVLRALDEAGVKIDVIAARGVGAIGALFGAVSGGERLWGENGFWRGAAVGKFYGWRFPFSVIGWALAAAAVIVALPLAAMALGLVVYPIDFLVKMVGGGGVVSLVRLYTRAADAAFASTALPTWLPRLVFLVLLAAGGVALAGAARQLKGRGRGMWWWRLVSAPLSSEDIVGECWRLTHEIVRGASHRAKREMQDVGRRYVELLTENLGQPGFRELLVVAHDVDAGRDLVFVAVGEERRRDLIRRATIEAGRTRRAEVVDLSSAREHLADVIPAALTVAGATTPRSVTFAADSYWYGETHRLCDRPGALGRVIDELVELDVRQLVIVTASASSEGPHALSMPRLDGRGRLGEYVRAEESAAARDAVVRAASLGVNVFVVRPDHNPIGPFDFEGGHDDRSDRPVALAELLDRGYRDAYGQFIEPVVGASGDTIERRARAGVRRT